MKIDEAIVNGEKIYLRKNFFGWKVVYPYTKEYNDGKFNWKKFIVGNSWIKLWITLGFCVLLVLAILEYAELGNMLNECNEQLNFIGGLGWLK